MTLETLLTEKEKLLRKEWLIFSIITYFIMIPINIAYIYWNQSSESTIKNFSTTLTAWVLLLFFSSLYFLLYYKCAYKKPGTKLLTFSLICLILGLIKSFRSLSTISFTLEACISIPELAISIWWAFLTFKMRQLNHQIKLRSSDLNLP